MTIIMGAALTVLLGSISQAKALDLRESSPTAIAPSAKIRHGRPLRLEPGMVVIDRQGARVGLIQAINRIDDSRPAVEMLVNGTRFTVKASRFTLSRHGEEAVISMTKSQIRTAAILNTD
jgi:hypothetical protein